jgi:nucleotide-binding universal stress UspA family protein
MSKILCATRGGADSYRTQDAAIALARRRNQGILFLYVVDLQFLANASYAVREDVVAVEMEKLGDFLLEMARERAETQGVMAEAVVRHGQPRQEITAAAREYDVDLVVLGRPTEGGRYSQEEVEAFAHQLEAETGVPARVM